MNDATMKMRDYDLNYLLGLLLALATLWHPDYEIKAWHQYLMYVLLIWLAIAVNVFGSQIIPAWNKAISKSTEQDNLCPQPRC